MSSFYCTFCKGSVYMADLYSPFGDGGLAICKTCIILGVEEILSIDRGPEGEDFVGQLALTVLKAQAQGAELEGLTPAQILTLGVREATRTPPGRDMTPGG